MEENKTFWNKSVNELTTIETLEIAALTPIITIASVVVIAYACAAVGAATNKIQKIKINHQNKKLKK